MKRLEYFLFNKNKIKSKGTEKEKEIDKLGGDILNLLDELYPGDKYKERWKSFNDMKDDFIDKIKNYQGNFSEYFEKMYEEIKEQERQALGYHIHSD